MRGNSQADKVWGFHITEHGHSLCQAPGNHRVRCYLSEYDKQGLGKNPGLFQITKGKEFGKMLGNPQLLIEQLLTTVRQQLSTAVYVWAAGSYTHHGATLSPCRVASLFQMKDSESDK